MVMPAPATLEYAPPKLIAEALRAGREPGVKEVRRLLERHGLLEAVTEGAATPEQIRALLSLPETKALPKVGRAVLLAQLGFALGIAGRYEETLATYSRATDLDPDFGAAWFNKGVTLGRLERHAEAIAVYDQVVARFGAAAELALQQQVAMALFNKGVVLGKLQRPTDEIAVYDQVVARFDQAAEPALQEPVARALFNKGVALGKLQRPTEAIAVYDQVVARFGAAPEPALQEQVARALVNKGIALFELGDAAEALASFENAYGRRLHLPEKGAALFSAAAVACVVLGVSGIKQRWLPDLETGTRAYIKWRGRARRDKQLPALQQVMKELEAEATGEDKEAFKEFQLSVRLLSIRDPFKGWKALSREVSKRWPKNVSAVQAIREQRR